MQRLHQSVSLAAIGFLIAIPSSVTVHLIWAGEPLSKLGWLILGLLILAFYLTSTDQVALTLQRVWQITPQRYVHAWSAAAVFCTLGLLAVLFVG